MDYGRVKMNSQSMVVVSHGPRCLQNSEWKCLLLLQHKLVYLLLLPSVVIYLILHISWIRGLSRCPPVHLLATLLSLQGSRVLGGWSPSHLSLGKRAADIHTYRQTGAHRNLSTQRSTWWLISVAHDIHQAAAPVLNPNVTV